MKACISCGENKPPEDFYFKNRSKGTLTGKCKLCVNETSREHYRNNKANYIDRNRRRREENQAFLKELKESQPCMDCGREYPYYVMQFDHVRGQKLFNVAEMKAESRERVLKEVSKCGIVCANCHAVRTFLRGSEEFDSLTRHVVY